MKSINFKKALLVVFLLVSYTAIINFIGSSSFDRNNKFKYYKQSKGFVLTDNEGYSKEISNLHTANIGLINDKETVSISTTIPDLNGILSPCLSFKSTLSTVEVYLDDELIYRFGQEFYDHGQMLPKKYHYVPLSENDTGKTIKITFMGTEKGSFSSFSDIYFGNVSDIHDMYLQAKKIPFIIGIFLCSFAFILFILCAYLIASKNKDYSIIFSSLISLILGAYLLGYNDVLILISDNIFLGTYLEYIMLFFAPAALMGFIITDNIGLNNKLCKFLLAFDLTLVTLFIALDIFKSIHICRFVSIIHILALIESLTCTIQLIVLSIKRKKKRKRSIKLDSDKRFIHSYSSDVLALGLFIFILAASFEIISFNYLKYFSPMGDRPSVSTLTIGTLTFVMALFLNFFFHNIDHFNSKAIFNKLENIAYTDELTGLANRALSEQILKDLANSKDNYAIISIDLDRLKTINDNFGHTSGDLYISNFARIIARVFMDATVIARIGGDEFLVAIKHATDSDCKAILKKFSDELEFASQASSEFNYSASYGYAIFDRKKLACTPHEIYMLADQRMYDMKQKHHMQEKGEKNE